MSYAYGVQIAAAAAGVAAQATDEDWLRILGLGHAGSRARASA